MKVLVIATLLTVLSVRDSAASSFYYDNDPEPKCVPDSRFNYDHNVCECNSEGTEIICNRDIYPSVSPATPILDRQQLQNLTIECVPNHIFKHLCQHCLCDESGKFATCVRIKCAHNERPYDTPERCIPGSVFSKGAVNGCICGADGKAACTRVQRTFGETNLPQCVPYSRGFWKECGRCDCTDNGMALCDYMGCSSFEFRHESILNITMHCQSKSIFDYNCHECVCGDGGDYAICSGKRSCSSKTRDTREKCSPGMIFADECNVCICGSNGKGVCTTFACDLTYRSEYNLII